MLFPSLPLLALASSVALALPAAKLSPRAADGWDEIETLKADYASLKEFVEPSHWAASGTHQYHVDAGCNATERRLIGEGLAEAVTLLKHARAHIRRFGNDSTFADYFGTEADSNQVLGLYDRLIEGDKSGINFTCTDLADECDGQYGVIPGYFLPSNHDVTVICPTYYLAKPDLQDLCAGGETLVEGSSELTQGAWFVHRLLHSPKASGGLLSDVVDTVAEAMELAQGVNQTQAVHSIHSVQYFALDTYAKDVLLPGVGCRGDPAKVAKRDLALHPRHVTY